jgi:hypothetical protein
MEQGFDCNDRLISATSYTCPLENPRKIFSISPQDKGQEMATAGFFPGF